MKISRLAPLFLLSLAFCPLHVSAQGSGMSAADPFLVRDTEAILVEPPASFAAGLNFSGLAFRRYQPDNSAPIDSNNSSYYDYQVEILGNNEWAVTLYNEDGELQMTTVEIEGEPTQVFSFPASNTSLQQVLYSAASTLNDDPAVGPDNHNLRANNTIFRFQSDYLYRTENNVEWRFTGENFFYRINDDFFPPVTRITLNGVETYSAENLAYDDSGNVFGLDAYDPTEIDGSEVNSSGLNQYRYQWFPNTGDASTDTCTNFWAAAEEAGTAAPWQTIPTSSLITPDEDGFYHLDDVLFTDYVGAAPGSFSLCYQVNDVAGNIGSNQGKYLFVLPDYISLECRDYQRYVLDTCTDDTDCLTVHLAEIASGYGQSSLENIDPNIPGTNMGNTLNCAIQTNSQGGYQLQIMSTDATADMTNLDPTNSDVITPITDVTSTSVPWLVDATEAKWGLRLNSNSGSDIVTSSLADPTKWGGDDYETGLWVGVSGVNQPLYQRTTDLQTSPTHQTVSASDQAFIQFGAEIGGSSMITSGDYHLNLVVTAVTLDVNP